MKMKILAIAIWVCVPLTALWGVTQVSSDWTLLMAGILIFSTIVSAERVADLIDDIQTELKSRKENKGNK